MKNKTWKPSPNTKDVVVEAPDGTILSNVSYEIVNGQVKITSVSSASTKETK